MIADIAHLARARYYIRVLNTFLTTSFYVVYYYLSLRHR